jgi:oxygen-independent coproporphyrinogen-3 oxidase
MHRGHSAERIGEAVRMVRAAGIESVSLDLILALPTSLGRSWAADLDEALSLETDHVSLYGLTVEESTPLARWVARGAAVEAPEEAYEAEYLAAHARLTSVGYEHYEVSNFARHGYRATHNAAYWSGAPYAGLGPAAHGFDGVARRWNAASYSRWLDLVTRGADPVDGAERLTPENHLQERVYLELRTAGGTVLNNGEKELVGPWVEAGWARLCRDRLMLTETGWLRLDTLAVALANARSR